MENSLLVFIMFQTALYDHKGKKRRSFNPYAYDWKDTVTRTPAHFNPRAWGKAPKGATLNLFNSFFVHKNFNPRAREGRDL